MEFSGVTKEILVYNQIYSYTAEQFITAIEAAKDDDISVRISCNGGMPEEAWGMIAKFSEHKKNKAVKVDGRAYSMAAYFLCYTEDVECLDVSQFVIHRAAYSKWFEESELMTEAKRAELDGINKHLRTALEAKIDVEKFEKIKKVTLDEVFSNDSRIDVMLTAKEAKQIGLVKKIVKITPQITAEINQLTERIAAEYISSTAVDTPAPIPNVPKNSNNTHKSSTMTIEILKAEHPNVYASVVKIGVEEERDRAKAFLVFNDTDPEAVKKAIEEGDEMTASVMAEMTRKTLNAQTLAQIEDDSQGEVTTGQVKEKKPLTAEEKAAQAKAQAFKDSKNKVFAELGIETESKK